MSEVKRKYTILPGVATPDISEILAASSDYSDPGDLSVSATKTSTTVETGVKTVVPQSAELQELQQLGKQVSEDEERAMQESQKKMDAIKNFAVMAPQSLDSLKEAAAQQDIDAERREQIENEMKQREEAAQKQKELEEARKERRAQQKKALDDMLASKADEVSDTATKVEDGIAEVIPEIEAIPEVKPVPVVDEIPEVKPAPAIEDIPEVDPVVATPVVEPEVKKEEPMEPVAEPETVSLLDDSDDASRVLSDEETADSFSDFFDD